MGDERADLRIDGHVLVATGDLRWEQNERFARMCIDLLETGEELIEIDLTDVSYIFSASVAIISDLAIRCGEKDRRLRVLINKRLEWILKNIWGAEARDEAEPNKIIPEALKAIEIEVVE